MKSISLLLLLFIAAGCARVNRWRGDFWGVVKTAAFEDSEGTRETGAVLYVNRAENLRTIGRDNKYLPTVGFSAVLLRRANRLVDPNSVPTNVELVVTGTLDSLSPRSRRGKELHQSGIPAQAFKPSLRVRRIRPSEPAAAAKGSQPAEKP